MTLSEIILTRVDNLVSEDADTRREVVAELGNTGSRNAVVSLVLMLFNEPLREIREAAAKSLKKIEVWIEETDRQIMIGGLISGDWKTREACAFVLGELGLKSSVGHLVKRLGDRNYTVHEAAGNALKKIRCRKAELFHEVFFCNKKERIHELRRYVKDVRRLLHAENPEVRKMATRTVGIFQDRESTEALISLLDSGDVDTCILSAEALGKIGEQKAAEPLERLSEEHPNVVVRVVAKKALSDIRDSKELAENHKETVRHLEKLHGRVCADSALRSTDKEKSKR